MIEDEITIERIQTSDRSKKRAIYLLILFCIVGQLAIVYYGYEMNSKYESIIDQQQLSLNNANIRIGQLQAEINSINDKDISNLPDLDLINNQISYLQLEVENSSTDISKRTIEKRILYFSWTDKFIIDKAMFVNSNGIIIDLDVKSSSVFKHSGGGIFNVSDRELKSALEELNDKIESQYEGSFNANRYVGEFDDILIDYSVDGNSIAYCENGVLKLNGE